MFKKVARRSGAFKTCKVEFNRGEAAFGFSENQSNSLQRSRYL